MVPVPGAVNLALLYINSGAVIPAKAGIQPGNTGFRVKPGMTNEGKRFLNPYTRRVKALHIFRGKQGTQEGLQFEI
jgi:hypothetical protein